MKIKKTLAVVILFYVILAYVINYKISSPVGYLVYEAQAMLLNYTDQRSFLQKIFDVNTTDWGCYQSRELSYILDYLDYNLIAKFMEHNIIYFFSISNLIGIIIICMIFIILTYDYIKLDIVNCYALLLIFLTSPYALLSGPAYLFRSSKIWVATSLIILYFLIYKNMIGCVKRKYFSYLTIAILSLSATLFDMQGTYFIILLIVVLSIVSSADKFNRMVIIGILSLSIVLKLIYNFILGPWIIFKINNYYPDFDFQLFKISDVLVNLNILKGTYFFVMQFKYLFGGSLLILLFSVCCIVIDLIITHNKSTLIVVTKNILSSRLLYIIIICSAMLLVMDILMFCRHNAIVSNCNIRHYYSIPSTVTILFGTAIILKIITKYVNSKLISICLFFMVIGNVIAIPQNANAIRSGYYTMAFNNIENTVVMLANCFWNNGKIDIGNNMRLEAIKLKQFNATVDSNSKIAVYSIDDLDEAIDGFNMAFLFRANQDNVQAHYNLGHALLRKGDLDAAIQEFRETVRINPNISDAHYNLGAIFFRKDDMDSAIDEFREALRINPNDAIARKDLNLALSKKHAK